MVDAAWRIPRSDPFVVPALGASGESFVAVRCAGGCRSQTDECELRWGRALLGELDGRRRHVTVELLSGDGAAAPPWECRWAVVEVLQSQDAPDELERELCKRARKDGPAGVVVSSLSGWPMPSADRDALGVAFSALVAPADHVRHRFGESAFSAARWLMEIDLDA